VTRFVSRTIAAIEMIAIVVFAAAFCLVSGMRPIGMTDPYSELSQWSHAFWYFSLLPLSYLALGYVRGPDSDFIARFDLAWSLASLGVVAVVITVVLNLFGVGRDDALQLHDLVASIVVVPFFHLLVAGTVVPPNKPLERTRGR
jgi:hypothetical protein